MGKGLKLLPIFYWAYIYGDSMKVVVEYYDSDSFLVEEVIKQAKTNYGASASVKVLPESDTPIDYLYFALQRLITGEQITLLYESGALYQKHLEKLRSETLYKVSEVLNEVLIDNESKIKGE
jgi:hypothetical protein